MEYLGLDYFHGTYASITSFIFGISSLNTRKYSVEESVVEDNDGDANSSVLTEMYSAFYPACRYS
jgi:hypothetical protein